MICCAKVSREHHGQLNRFGTVVGKIEETWLSRHDVSVNCCPVQPSHGPRFLIFTCAAAELHIIVPSRPCEPRVSTLDIHPSIPHSYCHYLIDWRDRIWEKACANCLPSTWRIRDKLPITTTISNSTGINSLAINNTLRPKGLPKATNHTLPRMPILRTTNNHINLLSSHLLNNRINRKSKSTTSLRRMACSSMLLKTKSRHFRKPSRFRSPNTMISGQPCW